MPPRSAIPSSPLRARPLRRRYHLHAPGFAYAATLVVVMLGAINGQNNILFWLFGLGVGALLVSGFLSGSALLGLQVDRALPARATRGQPFSIRYRIRSRHWFLPAVALTIHERPEPQGSPRPGWSHALLPPTAFALRVPPRGETSASTLARPVRRGELTFDTLRLWTTFPFGLTKKSITYRQHDRLLVTPRVPPVRPEAIRALGLHPADARASRRARSGDEFFANREYVPGDSIRHVAWRATARLGRVVVREHAASPAQHAWIFLRASPGPEGERAADAAAGLAHALLTQGLEVGVLDHLGRPAAPRASGARHLPICLDALALTPDTDPARPTPLPPLPPGTIVVASSPAPAALRDADTLWVTPDSLGVVDDVPPLDLTPTAPTSLAAARLLLSRWTHKWWGGRKLEPSLPTPPAPRP